MSLDYNELVRSADEYSFVLPPNRTYESPHDFVSNVGQQLIDKDCLLVHVADMAGVNYEGVTTELSRKRYVEHKVNFLLDTYNSDLVQYISESLNKPPEHVTLYDHGEEQLNLCVTKEERDRSKFTAYYFTMYTIFQDLGYTSKDFRDKPYRV